MKKLLLLPLLFIAFACSSDKMDEDTFTGLYDGYSWASLSATDEGFYTWKDIIYIKDNELNFGDIFEDTNSEACYKELSTIKEGDVDIHGELTNFIYEVNTPEMLKIIYTKLDYPDEINSVTITGDESTLYIEFIEDSDIDNEVFIKEDSFTWEDFQDFECSD